MPISTPMRMFAVRLSDEERAKLEQLAAERNVTMSYVIREGVRLYAQDAKATIARGRRVAT